MPAYVETDTRATADGHLIAFHDAELDRVTDRRGAVSGLRWQQIAGTMVSATSASGTTADGESAGGESAGGDEPIPLLEDVLGGFPELRFNIDLKGPGTVGPLSAVLRRTAAWDRVCLTSVSGRLASREFIRRAHALGLDVHVWTLNDRARIERVLEWGADGVMTDNLVLLRDILTERGQWHPRVVV